MRKFSTFLIGAVFGIGCLCLLLFPSLASAQYVAHVLIANSRTARPRKIDPALIDPWGIAPSTDGAFWVADQNTSVATAYTANGRILPKTIDIPCMYKGAPTTPCPLAPETPSFPPQIGPTGLENNIYASSGGFEIGVAETSAPAMLLFDTIGGLIVGWNPKVSADQGIVAVNNSGTAHYKGLAMAPPTIGEYLYASNNSMNGGIDVFGPDFTKLNTFFPTPPPSPYHPHGVDIINGELYATYAGMVPGGILDVCDLTPSSATAPTCTTLVESDTAPYVLNAPWAVALAPSDFGKFSDDLLVGNVNSGYIAAIDPLTGDFLGDLDLPNGTPISYRGMWDLDFEKARNGKDRLYFAAGPGAGKALFSQGVFGYITPAPARRHG